MDINRELYNKKAEILDFLRSQAKAKLPSIMNFDDRNERSKEINDFVNDVITDLIVKIKSKASTESWNKETVLKTVLMVTYCSYIVMIEYRNKVWPYEYMTFSRRIGELWDPFCQLCWDFCVNEDVELFDPPTFNDVKRNLELELDNLIQTLPILGAQKTKLNGFYEKILGLVTSGDINMKLDLHFKKQNVKYLVDLKSGFSSNEKGNTNRLLLVASIYASLNDKYECIIFVRSKEDEANHYLQTLKHSGLWQVYCEEDAYAKMKEFTGFDIKNWINQNINWKDDFDNETTKYLEENDLDRYLKW